MKFRSYHHALAHRLYLDDLECQIVAARAAVALSMLDGEETERALRRYRNLCAVRRDWEET